MPVKGGTTMRLEEFDSIQPFVRMVKIKKSCELQGDWTDIDHVLIYIAAGESNYLLGHSSYRLSPGSFLLIPPYVPHRMISSSDSMLVQYVVHFDFYSDPERMLLLHQSAKNLPHQLPDRENLLKGMVCFSSFSDESMLIFENLFLSMFREFNNRDNGHRLMMRGYATQMIAMLLSRIASPQPSQLAQDAKITKTWKLIKQAQEYIYTHYGEKLSNEIISEAVGVSPNYLSKIFREKTGLSLCSYVQNYRIDVAQKMLVSEKCNITEAAFRCGFSSIHVFSKTFKALRGVSPTAYLSLMDKERTTQPAKEPDYDLNRNIFYNI